MAGGVECASPSACPALVACSGVRGGLMAGPWRSKRQQQDGSKAASAAVQRRSEAARSGSRRSERAAAAQRARACALE